MRRANQHFVGYIGVGAIFKPVVNHVEGFPLGSKLHGGCGPKRLVGWINADGVPGVGDIVLYIATAALPQDKFAVVYGSHVLEHCYAEDTPGILR